MAAPVKEKDGIAVGIATVIRLLRVSVQPLPSVAIKLKSCKILVVFSGTFDSLKTVFKFGFDENKAPSISHSYVMGFRPFEELVVIMSPPLQITFCTEKKALGFVMEIGVKAGVD